MRKKLAHRHPKAKLGIVEQLEDATKGHASQVVAGNYTIQTSRIDMEDDACQVACPHEAIAHLAAFMKAAPHVSFDTWRFVTQQYYVSDTCTPETTTTGWVIKTSAQEGIKNLNNWLEANTTLGHVLIIET